MKTRKAVFPGSFDPLTMGHLDIINRSLGLFDEIIVAVLNNPDKKPMFSVEERCRMIAEVLPKVENCRLLVDSFSGLTADFAVKNEAIAIIRGIRAVADYEYELRMALMNRKLAENVETVFLMADEKYSYVSSQLIKQVFMLGGKIDGLVPPSIEEKMTLKVRAKKFDSSNE